MNQVTQTNRLTGFLQSIFAKLALMLSGSAVCAETAVQPVTTSIQIESPSLSDQMTEDMKQTMQDGGIYALFGALQANDHGLYRAGIDALTLKQLYNMNQTFHALLKEQKKMNHLLQVIAGKP